MNKPNNFENIPSNIERELDKLYENGDYSKINISKTFKNQTLHFYWEEEESCYMVEVVNSYTGIVGIISIGDNFLKAKLSFISACTIAENDKFDFNFDKDIDEDDLPSIVTQVSMSIVRALRSDIENRFNNERLLDYGEQGKPAKILFVRTKNSEFCKIAYDPEFRIFRVQFNQCPEKAIGISSKFSDAKKVQRMIIKRLPYYLERFSLDPLHSFSKSGRHYTGKEFEDFKQEISQFIFELVNGVKKKK
ncbi:MAG: hypothetical protein RBS56_04710 [Candidatus Gracilibacteria bacterium]|jgi:hypothetical protein|nr:hypothetical protein [Candidatus Gracilibacteria bacterium]